MTLIPRHSFGSLWVKSSTSRDSFLPKSFRDSSWSHFLCWLETHPWNEEGIALFLNFWVVTGRFIFHVLGVDSDLGASPLLRFEIVVDKLLKVC